MILTGTMSDHNRRYADSKLSVCLEQNETWTRNTAGNYHGFPESQEIFNAIINYLWSKAKLFIVRQFGSSQPFSGPPWTRIQYKTIYQEIRSLTIVTGFICTFLDLPSNIAQTELWTEKKRHQEKALRNSTDGERHYHDVITHQRLYKCPFDSISLTTDLAKSCLVLLIQR